MRGVMDEQLWVERRVSEAVEAATNDAHVFPKALIDEIQRLMKAELQEHRKPKELEDIVAIIIAANRGPK